ANSPTRSACRRQRSSTGGRRGRSPASGSDERSGSTSTRSCSWDDKGRRREEKRQLPLPRADPADYYRRCQLPRIEEDKVPPSQRGSLVPPSRGRGWAFRIYEDGKRTYRGGFETRRAALDALEDALDRHPQARPEMTVQELVDEFLDGYQGEQSSKATLAA